MNEEDILIPPLSQTQHTHTHTHTCFSSFCLGLHTNIFDHTYKEVCIFCCVGDNFCGAVMICCQKVFSCMHVCVCASVVSKEEEEEERARFGNSCMNERKIVRIICEKCCFNAPWKVSVLVNILSFKYKLQDDGVFCFSNDSLMMVVFFCRSIMFYVCLNGILIFISYYYCTFV
jgi:hypothetical protein